MRLVMTTGFLGVALRARFATDIGRRLPHCVGIDRERRHKSIEEALDLFVVQLLVRTEHFGGDAGTGDFTALRKERAAQLDHAIDVADLGRPRASRIAIE